MSIIFGLCMGAVIFCLVKHEEYWHVAWAIIAFAIYYIAFAIDFFALFQ